MLILIFAAVVRNNINSSCNNAKCEKKSVMPQMMTTEKRPIIVEAGDLGQPRKSSRNVIGEDVHPYLKQLEQALELEIKYRVPVNENPGGEMSGGITSGMRDGSAHVLRCLKVNFKDFLMNFLNQQGAIVKCHEF